MSKSKLQAVLQNNCPSCREGALFTHSALSTKFNKINHRCKNCNANLEPEVGFYYGAMYVSYGINVALMVMMSVLIYTFLDSKDAWTYIIGSITPMVLLFPFTFRLSRSVFLHLFGGLDYNG